MRIAELFRNHACLRELTAELPEGIEYDGNAECLRLTEAFDETASWGPFRFELVPCSKDAHLSVRTNDQTDPNDSDVQLFVRLIAESERWLMLLNFVDTASDGAVDSENGDYDNDDDSCNTAIVVNVRDQTLYLKARRPLMPGERLNTRICSSSGSGSDWSCSNNSLDEAEPEHLADTCDSASSADAEDSNACRLQDDDSEESSELEQLSGQLEARKRPASANAACGSSAKLPRLLESGGNRRSAVQVESSLRSKIRHCTRCGLFFTSAWMLQTHRQFHDLFGEAGVGQRGVLGSGDASQLVLSAPVLSDRGCISYVPVGLPRSKEPPAQSQQLQQGIDALQHVTASVASDPDGSSPDLPEASALDLTLPRVQTPAAASAGASLRLTQHSQQQQQQRQRSRQLQRQQQQNQAEKSGSASSLMSVCKDCKIGFFNYNNYLVHRSLYCQSGRVAAAAAATGAASGTPGRLSKHPLQLQEQQKQSGAQLPTVAMATPKLEALAAPASSAPTAAASTHSPSASAAERKFQCPYCQIRFHSPSTLTAHQAFYCPENPDKTAPSAAAVAPATAGASAGTAAPACADSPATGDASKAAAQQQQQQLQQQQQSSPPSWLPIAMDLSGSAGYKCSICGYIGQTERGMKMHAKVHSASGGFGGNNGASASSAALSPSEVVNASGSDGIRLPTSFNSDLLSSMTPEELGMLQHKTQPYSKRRTFKRVTPVQQMPQHPPQPPQQQLQLPLSLHPDLLRQQLQQQAINAAAAAAAASSAAAGYRHQGQLVCVRCGESFDQLESLLEHQETACPGLNTAAAAAAAAAAVVKLESATRTAADSVGRV
ncbi:hypothetical protein BOX15_Mlig020470g1 [Macrostomum lignano]|uniref:C2H2-type domain-containing protein n=1 Tax=Macrostomum lignano TaxID=282301 RepID=A0A267FJJ1_9PLAT|nr:hypothetical protein BOX15_Mlig020470g1 [Macrostomum lignano]